VVRPAITCKRCAKTRAHAGKGLCRTCYTKEWREKHGREPRPKPWATRWTNCRKCGTTDKPHASKGYCTTCDSQRRTAELKLPKVHWINPEKYWEPDRTGIPRALRERLERGEQ